MAADNVAKQLSCSWYIPGGGADTVADQIWQEMAAQGQTFYNASGDSDAYSGLISFPGDSPYITQVGGTTLTTSGPAGAYVSETVWNWGGGEGSSGGVSTQYGIPWWQTNVSMTLNYGSVTMRNTPDVALTADNVYVRADGRDLRVGGTSCASPLWAGFTALINQQAAYYHQPLVGFFNPTVYGIGLGSKYGVSFHDITSGNNGTQTHYPAVAGYDLATGWGTPQGQPLIDAIIPPDTLIIAPSSGFASSGAEGGPFSVSMETLVLTNQSGSNLTWTVNSNAPWLDAAPSGGTLGAGGSTNLVVSLDPSASNLAPGTYTVNVLVTNLTTGFGHQVPFSLQVHDPLVITPGSGFASLGPTGGPFTVTMQTYSLSNSGLASLTWSMSNSATWLDAASAGGTLGAGASTNVAVSLDPSTTNLAAALYTGDVVFSDQTWQLSQDLQFSLRTGELPVANGGFELGSFTGWTLSGNTSGEQVTTDPQYVHTGIFGAELGSAGSLGHLSQSLATAAGQVYLISFWLENQGLGTADEIQVNWEGANVYDAVNVGAFGWTNIQVLVGAVSTNSVLDFGVRNDGYAFGLDDVQVFEVTGVATNPPVITSQPTNETLTAGWTADFTVGVTGMGPLFYQWECNGSNVAGGNNAELLLSPVSLAEAGTYSVVVSNAFGATNSTNVTLTVNAPICDPPAVGLVSWWAGEGDADDSFGTNNGTLVGGVSFTNGEVGQAFSFDGVSGAVDVPDSSSLRLTNQITIEAWIKPLVTNGDQSIVAKLSSATGNYGYQFNLTQGNVLVGAFNSPGLGWPSSYLLCPIPLVLGTWNHVAWTYDQSVMKLYFNGQLVGTDLIGPEGHRHFKQRLAHRERTLLQR